MSYQEKLSRLQHAAPQVLPSLLICDFGNLEREIRALEEAGVKALHLDVMDGNFVPNISYGFPIVEGIRRLTDMPLDVHLMIEHPERYVGQFCDSGADFVSVHIEAVSEPETSAELIHREGAAAGIALNPNTELSVIEPYLDLFDFALVMSVNAGFGGQQFNSVALEKLKRLRELKGPEFPLEVDGGINEETIGSCSKAGSDWFVVGSGIFKHDDYGKQMAELTGIANQNR